MVTKNLNKRKSDEVEVRHIWSQMVKVLDKIVIGIIVVGFAFLISFFFNNYTGAAIGLVLIGSGITLKCVVDMKKQSKALWYMWIGILVIVLFLLGLEYVIPKISFG